MTWTSQTRQNRRLTTWRRLQMAALSVVLIGILYALVPEGHWRQASKWMAAAVVALVAIARMHLGSKHPLMWWWVS